MIYIEHKIMKFKLDLPSALNPKGLTGKVQAINPIWRAEDFEPFFLGGILLHHIAESTLNILWAYSILCLFLNVYSKDCVWTI